MSNEFERIVRVAPAYDERATGHGMHSAELQFYLKGERGTIQFVIHTGWFLPGSVEGDPSKDVHQKVFPSHIGWHSPTPVSAGETLLEDHCEWVDGPCYFTSSGADARATFEKLVRGGDKDVWAHLEQVYNKVFGDYV